jgi:amino acid transporter
MNDLASFMLTSPIPPIAADDDSPPPGDPFVFAGWGEARRIRDLDTSHVAPTPTKAHLGPWRATALCGNDITSSVLYVSALCAAQAGVLAPVVLLIVSGVLYLFRSVYAEVGSALPMNGGSYTLLLNTTTKRLAAVAACLTLLSYVATAVISAAEAAHYAHNLIPGLPSTPSTLVLLAVFAGLTIWGIGESAAVALGIFLLHLTVLAVLIVAGGMAVLRSPELFMENMQLPTAQGVGRALFYGFAAAMLGISGFESSSNFIEEQRPGVFPATLRNMWRAVTIANPLICLLALGLLPLAVIQQVPPDLLSRMGENSAGRWLGVLVSIDAVLVLSGAVLTSFVGVTGLARRMSLDQVLPQFLLRTNTRRGTNHWIILLFLAVCLSIHLATGGRIELLAGVYALSFLSVMALFAVGNLLLKIERPEMPRDHRASVAAVVFAGLAAVIALIGNMLLDPRNIQIFLFYFAATIGAVLLMFWRTNIIRGLLLGARRIAAFAQNINEGLRRALEGELYRIRSHGVVYFAKSGAVDVLNRAALYVKRNEQTSRLTVVHVHPPGTDAPEDLAEQLKLIDRLYPALRIDFVSVEGEFGPSLIGALADRLQVPRNSMFIGSPSHDFPHRIESLGGVRVIL